MTDYTFNELRLSPGDLAALRRYVDDGVPTGSFLAAVLENNLKEAVGRADSRNLKLLTAYVAWLYNEAPSACWGSPEKVTAWLAAFRPMEQPS